MPTTTYLLAICLSLLPAVGIGAAIPTVVRVLANGRNLSIQAGQPLRLAALDNDVSIFFSPIPGGSGTYQYQLVGFDRQWQSSPYPVARYTNLTGGDYTLRVRYQVRGRLSATYLIPVQVERELTEEWWFVPSVVGYVMLLLGAAIYFFLLYTFRQKLKVQHIRYRIAADLHDEVGATLSSIAISTRLAQKKVGDSQPDVQSILSTIMTDSEETIYTIRDTIWAINPDNDSLDKLFEKMRSFGFQVLTTQGIAFEFDYAPPPGNKQTMSMDQRRHVYLIVKEAINNIAKHAAATKARIEVSPLAEGLCLVISDNGRGFDTSTDYAGNGLKNFRERAALSFIELTLQSAPGHGTQLTLLVPSL
ncbi:histidine kinase [Fibrella sp. WM1]|uniref:ATP-binding protein n=1 Tax=Fibrella musci TaxID=3242485 RepID=UPI003521F1C0